MVAESYVGSEKRKAVLTFIRRHPGVSPIEIGHATGVYQGTLLYHLNRLESKKAVVKIGKYYFDSKLENPIEPLPKTQQKILETILGHPGITQIDVANYLGMSRQRVHGYIKKMRAEGICSPKNELEVRL